MNDIIIYSRTLSKHLNHLHKIFELFRQKRVNLIFNKSFLNYLFVILLNHRINLFDIIIVKKIVIISLRFFVNLKNLNFFLKLID